jgi:hypothetical protein
MKTPHISLKSIDPERRLVQPKNTKGREPVRPALHLFATGMVAIGALGSAYWIFGRQQLDAHAGRPLDQCGGAIRA